MASQWSKLAASLKLTLPKRPSGGGHSRLTPSAVEQIVDAIPDAWLGDEPRFASVGEHRAAYRDYLLHRLEPPRSWVEDAADAQALSV